MEKYHEISTVCIMLSCILLFLLQVQIGYVKGALCNGRYISVFDLATSDNGRGTGFTMYGDKGMNILVKQAIVSQLQGAAIVYTVIFNNYKHLSKTATGKIITVPFTADMSLGTSKQVYTGQNNPIWKITLDTHGEDITTYITNRIKSLAPVRYVEQYAYVIQEVAAQLAQTFVCEESMPAHVLNENIILKGS
jgi:hypothetical protein